MKKKLLMVLLISTMILAGGTVARAEKELDSNIEESSDKDEESTAFIPENPIISYTDDIAISEENFPDENFRAYVKRFDADGNDYFSRSEIDDITSIDVNYQSIKSLIGIEHFTGLTSLNCISTGLTSLNVSQNPNLGSLRCDNNVLTTLDVSQNLNLSELSCYGNKLTKLDVSQNLNLSELNCYGNKLTKLDVSQNLKLNNLNCSVNQLTALDVSRNSNLNKLSCNINALTILDVGQNPNLTELYCNNNQIKKLDVSKNPKLSWLQCSDNQLTALDVSGNPDLYVLHVPNNQLTVLDISRNSILQFLTCSNNQIVTLDVSHNSILRSLDCSGNQLTVLDISRNSDLSSLSCSDNQLTALDISRNSDLSSLSCSGNQLTVLDISRNSNLSILNCSGNQLTALDVSGNIGLTNLKCYDNHLAKLDLVYNENMLIRHGGGQADQFDPYLFGVYVTPQTATADIVSTNGKWTLDLGAIVGKENLGRITLATNGAALSVDGIVTFSGSNMPTELVYNYDTKNPAEDTPMTVNVALTAKNIDDQTGNDITVDTGDLDMDSIYKNYNLNLNTNIEIILSQDNPSKDDLDKLTQAAGANGYSIAATYEILMTLYSDGQKVTDITDNFGRIKLTFKVDTSLARQSAVVYQLHNNSQIIVHDGLTVNTDGTVTITVDKFSAFAVSVKKSSDATSKPDTNKPDTSKPDTNKPETGKDDTNKTDSNIVDTKQPETNQDGTDQSDAGKTDATLSNASQNAPKTGDNANVVFWVVVAIMASMTGILTIKRSYRN